MVYIYYIDNANGVTEMKNIYEILSTNGVHMCYQVAASEEQALSFARRYGYRRASKAVFVREDN